MDGISVAAMKDTPPLAVNKYSGRESQSKREWQVVQCG